MADSQKKSANIINAAAPSEYTRTTVTPLANGGVELSITNATWTNCRYINIPVTANSTYTITVYIDEYSGTGTFMIPCRQINGDGTVIFTDTITQTGTKTHTFTTEGGTIWLGVYLNNSGTAATATAKIRIMLNEGATALPYEPYSATGWVHSLRKLTTATEAVENPLYSDGTPITAYTLKGNEEHTGTSTPSNPVDVNGVGERTKNLYKNVSTGSTHFSVAFTNDTQILTITALRTTTSGNIYYMNRIADELLENGERYYILSTNISGVVSSLRLQLRNKDGSYAGFDTSNTVVYDDTYGMFVVGNPFGGSSVEVTEGQQAVIQNILVVKHGETTDYEPYGYKIPISSGGVTTNIYLGSTQTVRKIKKYTFTGEETVSTVTATTDSEAYCCGFKFSDIGWTDIKDYDKLISTYGIPVFVSSHFAPKRSTRAQYNDISVGEMGCNAVSAYNRYIVFCVSGLTTSADYSAWFAQQYANGTPVEVYYILENETTGIVNEPLMKIGTYADTLSNAASIPTTEGANSITVDTTVQPSEFTATWTGWHDASVKIYGRTYQLFNKAATNPNNGYIGNGYLSSTGEKIDNADYRASEYIPCTAGATYTIVVGRTLSNPSICFYDENHTYIDGTSYNMNNKFTVTAPVNAVYMRGSYHSADSDIYMIYEGTETKSYIAYYDWS